jgi:lipopolysaccharide/colanic/teichoic acid biosynthesis glycosyltransferase
MNYFFLAVTTIIFILLSTITIAASLADGDTTSTSQTRNIKVEKIHHALSSSREGEIKNTFSQLCLEDIKHIAVFPSITDHMMARVIGSFLAADILIDKKGSNVSIIPQPAGIVLMGSAILGFFLRFLRERYLQFKPLVDYVLSFVGLVIASPLLLVVAIIIKLTSPGPMFYTQERVGRNGRLFKIIKFRSMHVGAESETGPVWAGRNDARITSFGRFLRSTHIDELPQIINVLKGDMSIIGPRPERPHFVDMFKDEIHGYTFRMTVKPGITGLAQCYHRYDETIRDVERKLRYDALYIRKMCWTLDMRIILKTLAVSFS